MELNPKTTAVIAVHCQGDIVGPDGAYAEFFYEQVERRGIIENIERFLDSARGSGATIIYTRVAFAPDYSNLVVNSPLLELVAEAGCLKDGSLLAEIVDPLKPEGTDFVVTHQRVGGFTEEMVSILEGRHIDTLLFAGVATNASVESTARVASDAAYRTVIIEDACSAASPEAHEASIASLSLLAEITSTDAVTWVTGIST